MPGAIRWQFRSLLVSASNKPRTFYVRPGLEYDVPVVSGTTETVLVNGFSEISCEGQLHLFKLYPFRYPGLRGNLVPTPEIWSPN